MLIYYKYLELTFYLYFTLFDGVVDGLLVVGVEVLDVCPGWIIFWLGFLGLFLVALFSSS